MPEHLICCDEVVEPLKDSSSIILDEPTVTPPQHDHYGKFYMNVKVP
jgi:hypothetical protein